MSGYYPYRLIGLCPAGNRDVCNALADTELFGFRGPVFSIPLSLSGEVPATYYGCHAFAEESFVLQCENEFAATLADYGVTVFYLYDFDGQQHPDFWDQTLAANGLLKIQGI